MEFLLTRHRASLAGITALPTDPAVLLQLGGLANSLASALPTSSVLAVLLTAAPSGFVSSIVNDPSYAASFESAFSAGNSPSWFNALPTDVRSYLHTYSGFGGVATAAGAIKNAQSEVSGSGIHALGTGTASGASGTAATGSSSTTMGSSASAASVMSASSASAAAMSATSIATTEGNTATSAAAGGATSSSAKAGAAQATGAVAFGLAGAAGILGLAIAL